MRLEWLIRKEDVEQDCQQKQRLLRAPNSLDEGVLDPRNVMADPRILVPAIGHDINNILTYTLTNVEFLGQELQDGTYDPKRAQEQIEEVKQGIEKITALIKRLYSPFDFTPENTTLGEVVADTTKLLIPGLKKTKHYLVVDNRSVNVIYADRSGLERVIVNLVTNARDAMKKGGLIELSTRDTLLSSEKPVIPGPYVSLQVTDHDGGIPDEILAKVCRPGISTKAHGRGLGLAVVRYLVTLQRGYMTVQTEKDIGTTFTIYLPKLQYDDTEKIKMDDSSQWKGF